MGDFRLELIMAGYDPDSTAKIGTLTIVITQRAEIGRDIWWEAKVLNDWSLQTVGKDFVYKTRGIKEIAERALGNPENFPGYSILQKYAAAKKADNGSSLLLSDMDNMGRTLVTITSLTFKKEVGLNKQVALLRDGKVVSIDQPNFGPLRKPLHFIVFHDVIFNGRQSFGSQAVGYFDHVEFLAPDTQPAKAMQAGLSLDHGVFVNCHFRNVVLFYDGGPVYFDESNTLENTSSHSYLTLCSIQMWRGESRA